jgi:hypothetical protein
MWSQSTRSVFFFENDGGKRLPTACYINLERSFADRPYSAKTPGCGGKREEEEQNRNYGLLHNRVKEKGPKRVDPGAILGWKAPQPECEVLAAST